MVSRGKSGVQRTACPTFLRLHLLVGLRHSCARQRLNFAKLRTDFNLVVLLQEWIRHAFPSDRCRRSMAGEHSHVVAERK